MTANEARRAVRHIKAMSGAGDHEAAHSEEDELREAFIRFVSKGRGQLAEIAKIVLSTEEVDFERWAA